MKDKSTYAMPFRRRRESKTSYKRRLALVKSGLLKLCVRKSNRYITAQLIEFKPVGDKVLEQASSKNLEKFGWLPSNNLPSAYLTGALLASKAKKAGFEKAILDIGFNTPVHGSRVFAVLKGAIENGLQVQHDSKALPNNERVNGKHIEDYAKALDEEQLKKKFSKYLEKGINVRELSKLFNEVKEKINKEGGK